MIMINNGVENANDPYGTKKIQAYYLPMMDDLHQYCEQNNIKYSLSGGSLLGAVRHKGFIPWDDDVDIMFDRNNYDKFLSTFSNAPMEGYEIVGVSWVTRISRKDNPLIKNEEQCIDLFAFDPVPDNKRKAKIKVFKLRILQGMLKENPDYKRFSFFYKCLLFITWLFGKGFSREWKRKKYDQISRSGIGNKKINIYNTWFGQIGSLEFDKNITNGYVLLDFEGRKYMAIQGYKNYLTELYGDYMQLPPEEQRKPTHHRE